MTSTDQSSPPPPATTHPASRLMPLAVVLTGAYIGAQMLADIASLKIGVVAGLAVDMGTFIYPLTFTLRDLVHKALGKRAAQSMVLTAAGVNVFMALYLWGAALVPAAASWPLQEAFAAVLGPVWRIVLASIVAEVISELIDTEIYEWFIKRTTRHQWARVLISNSVSVPVDNLVFVLGAFAPLSILGLDGLSWRDMTDIFLINLYVKYGMTILSIPLIYLVPRRFDTALSE
jgi:uncharacterized integral membrane protein (TIGR00697 family)